MTADMGGHAMTKPKRPLPPRMRSRGFAWFLTVLFGCAAVLAAVSAYGYLR